MEQLNWKKLVAEFFGTLILVVIAVGVATEIVRLPPPRFELLGRRGRHRPRLRPGARGARLRHRPDLGRARQPSGDARLHRHRPYEARRGRRLHRGPAGRRDRRAPTSSTP